MEQTNATFQLVEYRFPTFTFNSTVSTESKENSLRLELSASGNYTPVSRLFTVRIDLQLSSNEESVIQLRCEATFRFTSELAAIPEYFYANSIAIVYPYIRAFCSLMTTQSNNTHIILPVLNLTQLGEELKQNTTILER